VGQHIANGFTVMLFPSWVAGQDWAGQLLPGLASPLLPGQRSVLYCPLCFLFPHNTGALQLGPSSYTIQPPSHCFTLYFILSHFPSVPLSSFSSQYVSLLIFSYHLFSSPSLYFPPSLPSTYLIDIYIFGVISILRRHLCLRDIILWDILQWDILLRLYTSTKNLHKPLIKILRNTLSKKYVNKYF
jgi:hypothetical protein